MKNDYLQMPLADKLKLLEQMKKECEYYLEEGGKRVSALSGGDVDAHLECMKDLLSSIDLNERPDWLTYSDIHAFSQQMDHRRIVDFRDFEQSYARFINLSGKASKVQKHAKEVFFSIEHRNSEEKDGKRTFRYGVKEYGYLTVTAGMRAVFDTLFRERPDNRHLQFIEWEDSWNVVFHDGIYISSKMCRMEKEEFEKWYQTITPAAKCQ